jgi:hypothetical protein
MYVKKAAETTFVRKMLMKLTPGVDFTNILREAWRRSSCAEKNSRAKLKTLEKLQKNTSFTKKA